MEFVCWDVQEQITEYLSSRDLESLAQVSTAYLLYLLNINIYYIYCISTEYIYSVDQVCWTQAATAQLSRRRTRQHGITLVVRSDDSDTKHLVGKILCVYKNISYCSTRKL